LNAAPAVPRLRSEKGGADGAALSVLPPAARGIDEPSSNAPLARAPAPSVGRIRSVRVLPAEVAFESLAAPLLRGEGIRVGALGISGAGKTTTMMALLEYLCAEQLLYVLLSHDVKLPAPQYAGQVLHEADRVLAAPPELYPYRAVLRKGGEDHTPSVETAARITKRIAYAGIPAGLNVDELKKALTPSGREFEAKTLAELFSEGRAYGASVFWTEQLPQRVPGAAYDQSRVMLHRSGQKSLGYLVDQRVIDQQTANVVAQLGTGQFALVSPEDDFDGAIYQVQR
jgi:hypothetical protein